jgi:hypothetical protein
LTHAPCLSLHALRRNGALGALLVALAAPAAADKPRGPQEAGPGGGSSGVVIQLQIGGYFTETQRAALRSHGAPGAANCPPGLAKKGNGCLPPGQAKAWRLGQPLPASVVFLPLPRAVAVQIGRPPPGHEFVRVATDILLIAIGTRLVVDAIEDLGGW